MHTLPDIHKNLIDGFDLKNNGRFKAFSCCSFSIATTYYSEVMTNFPSTRCTNNGFDQVKYLADSMLPR